MTKVTQRKRRRPAATRWGLWRAVATEQSRTADTIQQSSQYVRNKDNEHLQNIRIRQTLTRISHVASPAAAHHPRPTTRSHPVDCLFHPLAPIPNPTPLRPRPANPHFLPPRNPRASRASLRTSVPLSLASLAFPVTNLADTPRRQIPSCRSPENGTMRPSHPRAGFSPSPSPCLQIPPARLSC